MKSDTSKKAKTKELARNLLPILCPYEKPQQRGNKELISQKPIAILDPGETNLTIETRRRANIPAPHDYRSQKGRLP